MKKFYLGLCIVLLALVLISCGGKKDEDSKTTAKDIVTVSESSKEQEEKSVSESEEKAESLFETVANKAKEIVSSKTFTKKDILDDFGEPTGRFSYNSKAFIGTYKASGRSGNASLYISIDNNKKVSLKVVEDGNTGSLIGAIYTTDKFDITLREENGNDVRWLNKQVYQDENKLYNSFLIPENKSIYDADLSDWFSSSETWQPFVRNKAIKLVLKNDNAIYNFNSIDTSELEGLLLDKAPYEKALSLMEKGEYQQALEVFEKLKTDSKDLYRYYGAEKQHKECELAFYKVAYEEAVELKEEGKYQEALEVFEKLKTDSKDSYEYYEAEKQYKECELAFWKEKGSAGGYVFYDCDADNDSGNADGLKSNECGWRYLEAAPTDVLNNNGERTGFPWGNDGIIDTERGIGEGKNNTDAIVGQANRRGMNFLQALVGDPSNIARSNNAAKACVDYEYNGFSDWFLPSRAELALMYENLKKDICGFVEKDYWSSTGSDGSGAWCKDFWGGSEYDQFRKNSKYVRPVRAF